jgi:predicted esterase/catechol 2,3-dioxygenase-like lactoylglutathione lyase family enzyme
LGIHHITAIVEEPQENIDFYTRILGLRLVKQTVNFDDPYTYHLYYGDDQGRPGTLVTFFPWPDGRRGSRGAGQISAMAFAVPVGALPFWQQHLTDVGIRFGGPEERFGAAVLSLYDPAGLLLELVEQPAGEQRATQSSEIPPEAAIQRLFGVTLTVAQIAPTGAFLTEQLGFRPIEGVAEQSRYAVGTGTHTAIVDLIGRPDLPRGQIAAGSVHHVAWRVADQPALKLWQAELARQGVGVTDVRDRQYFRSIYFREPGEVLFELATDPPGFAIDEAPAELGTHLMLPPWLEPRRDDIERHLPPISVPGAAARNNPLSGPTTSVSAHQREEIPAMEQSSLSFVHQFIPAQASDAPTLLLLHGTGGNEHDLLTLGRALYPQAALLSPRGQVLENGMPRFFRRLAEGVFDLDDLRRRAGELASFVAAASEVYQFDPRRVIAVGYSNGANIAASLLLLHPQVLAGAVLFHAMVPIVPQELPDLHGVPVFMGAGQFDPLIPPPQTEQLALLLQQAGAEVALRWEPGGHTLSQAEVDAATSWLRTHASAQRDEQA